MGLGGAAAGGWPAGLVGVEEGGERLVEQAGAVDYGGGEGGGGGGVEEGVMPAATGNELLEGGGELEGVAEGGKRVAGEVGPGGAREVERVDPRAEAVAGEGAEEAFLGAFGVGEDDGSGEQVAQGGPELDQRGGIDEIVIGDAVNLAGRPGDGAVGPEVGNEAFAVAGGGRPGGDPDLDGDIGPAAGGAGGLEVDGGEAELADGRGGVQRRRARRTREGMESGKTGRGIGLAMTTANAKVAPPDAGTHSDPVVALAELGEP